MRVATTAKATVVRSLLRQKSRCVGQSLAAMEHQNSRLNRVPAVSRPAIEGTLFPALSRLQELKVCWLLQSLPSSAKSDQQWRQVLRLLKSDGVKMESS